MDGSWYPERRHLATVGFGRGLLRPRHGSLIWASSARRAGRACAIWRFDALTGRRPLSSLRLSGVLPLRLDERAFMASFQWLPPRSTRPRLSGIRYPIRKVEKERMSRACSRAGTRFRPAVAAKARARTSSGRTVRGRISQAAKAAQDPSRDVGPMKTRDLHPKVRAAWSESAVLPKGSRAKKNRFGLPACSGAAPALAAPLRCARRFGSTPRHTVFFARDRVKS